MKKRKKHYNVGKNNPKWKGGKYSLLGYIFIQFPKIDNLIN